MPNEGRNHGLYCSFALLKSLNKVVVETLSRCGIGLVLEANHRTRLVIIFPKEQMPWTLLSLKFTKRIVDVLGLAYVSYTML